MYFATKGVHRSVYLFPRARPADFTEPAWDGLTNFCGKPRETPFPWVKGLMTAWFEYYVKGDLKSYSVLYGQGGQPTLPNETSDSIAHNSPQDLAAYVVGDDGVRLAWRDVFTDTTVIKDQVVLMAREKEAFWQVAEVPLDQSSYRVDGLEESVTYRFSVAYRDHAGKTFQRAEPVELAGGQSTPTPTATRQPIHTPTADVTAQPTETNGPEETPTPTETRFTAAAYIPHAEK
jgi:hypothetical protein